MSTRGRPQQVGQALKSLNQSASVSSLGSNTENFHRCSIEEALQERPFHERNQFRHFTRTYASAGSGTNPPDRDTRRRFELPFLGYQSASEDAKFSRSMSLCDSPMKDSANALSFSPSSQLRFGAERDTAGVLERRISSEHEVLSVGSQRSSSTFAEANAQNITLGYPHSKAW